MNFRVTTLLRSLKDYSQFFSPSGCVGFQGYEEGSGEFGTEWLAKLHSHEGDTLARMGVLRDERFCRSIYVLNGCLLVSAMLAGGWAVLRGNCELRALTIALLTAFFANDVFFALLSGGYERYHQRALFLLGLVTLAVYDELRSSHTGALQ